MKAPKSQIVVMIVAGDCFPTAQRAGREEREARDGSATGDDAGGAVDAVSVEAQAQSVM
jgi:hypothetical protein